MRSVFLKWGGSPRDVGEAAWTCAWPSTNLHDIVGRSRWRSLALLSCYRRRGCKGHVDLNGVVREKGMGEASAECSDRGRDGESSASRLSFLAFKRARTFRQLSLDRRRPRPRLRLATTLYWRLRCTFLVGKEEEDPWTTFGAHSRGTSGLSISNTARRCLRCWSSALCYLRSSLRLCSASVWGMFRWMSV